MKWKKWLFLPLWLLILLTMVCTAALTLVFVRDLTEAPVAYGVYVLSFYTLTADCVYGAVVLPKQLRTLRAKIDSTAFGHRYMTDPAFQHRVSLCVSLAVNLLYVAVNVLSWALYRSMWFMILACYYGILAILWALLVARHGHTRQQALRRARLCAGILLLVNVVLSGAVMMILYQNKGFVYHGVLIYGMALYAFYSMTHAILGLLKNRRFESPVLTVSKVISLSAALVSMLSLETAMFAQFGQEMTAESQWLMIVLTGAGVSVLVVAMSVGMMIKCEKEIRNGA